MKKLLIFFCLMTLNASSLFSQNAFEEFMVLEVKPEIGEEIRYCEMFMIVNDQLIALNDYVLEDGILTIDILPLRDYYFLINGEHDFTLTPEREIIDERDLSISSNALTGFHNNTLVLNFIKED